MNNILKTLKTIMTGLSMQHSPDYLTNNEKQRHIRIASQNKQQAIKESVIEKDANQALDVDSALLNQV